MKTVVLLWVFAVCEVVYSVEEKGIKEIFKECAEESGFKGDIKDIPIENATREGKCFIKCVAEKEGKLEKDGKSAHTDIESEKLKVDSANASSEVKAALKKMIDDVQQCMKEDKSDEKDPCESVYKIYQCEMKAFLKAAKKN